MTKLFKFLERVSEVKNDNSKLSKQIEDYVELKEHYSHLKEEGFI